MREMIVKIYAAIKTKLSELALHVKTPRPALSLGILGILFSFFGGWFLFTRSGDVGSEYGSRPISICKPHARYCVAPEAKDGTVVLPAKTSYWHSRHSRDDAGLSIAIGPDGQIFRNIASVAFDVADRGREYGLATGCAPLEMTPLSRTGLDWIEHHARNIGGATVWTYNYDTQVNDVLLKAGWPSAFAQAAIISRLLMAYCATNEQHYLDLARRAGNALMLPVSKGGLRSQNRHFVWFQEIPIGDRYAPFILNAHLYSIFSLLALDRMSPGWGFRAAALKGLQSLERALPVIDNGYWNRYDLRPRYMETDFLIQTSGDRPRSVVLKVGDATSTVDLETGLRQPAGNAVWDVELKDNPGVRESAAQFTFILPGLRKFEPADLAKSARLLVHCKGCGEQVAAYSYGIRPNLNEWYRLTELGRTREGDSETIEFSSSLSDYSWGQVAPEYIPFHASLMALIARMTERPEYLVYAYRWQNFYRNWLHDKNTPSTEPVFRERFPYQNVQQLGAYLAQHFRYELPSAVSESELKTAIDSMPEETPSTKAVILKTLALPAGEF